MSNKIQSLEECESPYEMEKFLSSQGWQKRMTGGSHMVFSYPGKASLSLPAHKTLSPGTKRNLLKAYYRESYYAK
jgi:predicted RNA binding protein YcfA (HicA-like mRNA interferase family)